MTYPLTKKVCQLDEQGIYVGQTDADLSPEEKDNGIYLMPAGCVDVTPPEDKKGFVAKWTGGVWEYVENHIGETVYSTITKEPLVINEFGSIPQGYTLIKPANAQDEWDGSTWIISPEKQTVLFAQQKEGLLNKLADKADQLKNGLLAGYPQTEIESFYRQEKEALAWQDDHNTSTPMLSQIARVRGVPLDMLISKVIEKSSQFAVAIGIIIGQRQAFEDRLLALKTPEELTSLEQEIEQWQFQTN